MAMAVLVARALLLGVMVGALVFASVSDIRSFTIPNEVSVVLAVAFVPAAWLAGLPWAVIAIDHYLAGLAALCLGFGAFALRWLGGGDVKLFAALAVWTGWAGLPAFVMATALAGGALAAFVLVAGTLRTASRGRRAETAYGSRRADRLPYGVAIGFGMMTVLPRLAVVPEEWRALMPWS